jgi:hypothetical protein
MPEMFLVVHRLGRRADATVTPTTIRSIKDKV